MNVTFSDRISGVKPSAIREILKLSTDPGIIAFSAGNPSPDAFPVEAIAQITAKVLRENPVGVLQYSLTEGYPSPAGRAPQNLDGHPLPRPAGV